VKIVVGLGNPGKQYADTPHNAGFEVVNDLSVRLDCRLRRSLRFDARIGHAVRAGEPVLLVQPQTYMNNSGMAVAAVVRYYKADPRDLIVVSDDADLALGRLRVRVRGGSGGHKGLASIIQHVGTQDFARVRVGIGREKDGVDLVEHVLTPLSAEGRKQMSVVVDRAAQAVLCSVDCSVEEAMNRFNADPPAGT
jgi:peptidyl-tRNA hydrolase, PTH1 family